MKNNKYSTAYMPSYLKDIIKDISNRYRIKKIDVLINAIKNYRNCLEENQPHVKALKEYFEINEKSSIDILNSLHKLNERNQILNDTIKELIKKIN